VVNYSRRRWDLIAGVMKRAGALTEHVKQPRRAKIISQLQMAMRNAKTMGQVEFCARRGHALF
jgi:hypothetical protein